MIRILFDNHKNTSYTCVVIQVQLNGVSTELEKFGFFIDCYSYTILNNFFPLFIQREYEIIRTSIYCGFANIYSKEDFEKFVYINCLYKDKTVIVKSLLLHGNRDYFLEKIQRFNKLNLNIEFYIIVIFSTQNLNQEHINSLTSELKKDKDLSEINILQIDSEYSNKKYYRLMMKHKRSVEILKVF